ncbi:MAG: unknown heme protein [Candidatus Brocadia sinica]|uniref:Carboxypeptidase regulatory-like domain-containing protein n=1 Tax=Candidatus Brocadia sinica JPN1 TaxID=1197129 RepID=A0ABQ0K1W9_9BACT|nr:MULTISPECIES: carboxypeptidase-like regulatory domain-containing protein [Brocadia]KXK31016.1 MAG: unknown heme protein [Candidatus Brocadia sinica]NOG42823.1 carboxypeptidase regulatory-like domain-containing protein [Planctomycetota bacterium]MCK6467049.1 carboxypeptidase-like regulatory domain-containing protein [Candidatus Brocadia sinica]NUO06867.1 carboxypeptidase regulatory-like domain-containing protein [Candidatus Brocadia sinica]GAN35049.1 hypothetical protein BROSI_A3595 [Candida
MCDFSVQRLLKYVVCFFVAAVFLITGAQVSFAGGRDEDAVSHNAGKDCLTSGCHASGGWKRFSLGGTIYTDSDGTDARAGAHINVMDANGIIVTLTSDQLGNFYSAQSMTAPFLISVSYRGRMVKMPGAASGGGCNADGCHVVGLAGRVSISTKDLDLAGTVTGADYKSSTDGTVLANAKVSLSRKGRIKYRTTTDSAGAFTLKSVKANEYTLKVTRKGYKTYKQSYEMKQKDVASLEVMLNKK